MKTWINNLVSTSNGTTTLETVEQFLTKLDVYLPFLKNKETTGVPMPTTVSFIRDNPANKSNIYQQEKGETNCDIFIP